MKLASLEAIFRGLQEAEARYLVVGGLAVVAHGYVRVTQDLDLVLDLSEEALPRSLRALDSLGYHPIVPVALFDFARPELRQDWIENRNMKVFNLVSDRFPDVVIDVFVREPFAFDAEYRTATEREVAPHIRAKVLSLPALMVLKREADRPKDRLDIDNLRLLYPDI
jgi:hypothetical protein